jgi:cation transport regulator
MSAYESIDLLKMINVLKQLKHNISIDSAFDSQMIQLNTFLKNDETGMVNTVLDFMTHSATVPYKIETKNDTLDSTLTIWQKTILNKDINIDIPRGLRGLSTQYFIERWKSSFVALNVQWGEVDFGSNGRWIVPTRMWLADGSSIVVDGSSSSLINRQYYLDKSKEKELKNTTTKSVIIRKPYASWYELYPVPFLIKRGVLFNALLKAAIIDKQADVIQQIIPYLLLLKSGNDKLAELNMLAGYDEMKKLKDSIIEATKNYDNTGEVGKMLATLSYDVNVEHFIPDLVKIFDPKITAACDKNILAGLGMIEVEGFSKNRQQTVLNPKMLVEEVKDAVADWSEMLEEVMLQMLDRNKARFPKLTANEIRVVPGLIKSFMTDDMRALIRSLYDRGLVAKQTTVEDIAELDFEVQVERRKKESDSDMDKTLFPPVIQNYEQYAEPTKPDNNNLENQDKKPGSPESKNFKNAEKENIIAPYKTIDDLPDSIKVLPVSGQLLWLKTFNSVYNESGDEEKAIKVAWSQVKKVYKKNSDGNWVKKD